MVTGLLKFFSIDVYVLFYPDATLSFITFLVSKKFDILPDILKEPFMVSTFVGESIVAKRMCSNWPIMLP